MGPKLAHPQVMRGFAEAVIVVALIAVVVILLIT
jgi:hypothetical protein